MSNAKPFVQWGQWDQQECATEAAFIEGVNPTAPGRLFNNQPQCFGDYCEMQARQIDRSGFPEIAEGVRVIRDQARAAQTAAVA